ncbi:MAG: hypothetical protein ABSG01_03645 [Anaerolineales bacterium]|jgi:hypothetical protein
MAVENEPPLLFRNEDAVSKMRRKAAIERPTPTDHTYLFPASIRRCITRFVYGKDEKHLSFEQSGGHDGLHPHLVDEFVRSIIEERAPKIEAITAANWTAAEISAHESAMRVDQEVIVPIFQR